MVDGFGGVDASQPLKGYNTCRDAILASIYPQLIGIGRPFVDQFDRPNLRSMIGDLVRLIIELFDAGNDC